MHQGKLQENLESEISILKSFRHGNIVELYDIKVGRSVCLLVFVAAAVVVVVVAVIVIVIVIVVVGVVIVAGVIVMVVGVRQLLISTRELPSVLQRMVGMRTMCMRV